MAGHRRQLRGARGDPRDRRLRRGSGRQAPHLRRPHARDAHDPDRQGPGLQGCRRLAARSSAQTLAERSGIVASGWVAKDRPMPGGEAEQQEPPAQHPPEQARARAGAARGCGRDEMDRPRDRCRRLARGSAAFSAGEFLDGQRALLVEPGQPLERGRAGRGRPAGRRGAGSGAGGRPGGSPAGGTKARCGGGVASVATCGCPRLMLSLPVRMRPS